MFGDIIRNEVAYLQIPFSQMDVFVFFLEVDARWNFTSLKR